MWFSSKYPKLTTLQLSILFVSYLLFLSMCLLFPYSCGPCYIPFFHYRCHSPLLIRLLTCTFTLEWWVSCIVIDFRVMRSSWPISARVHIRMRFTIADYRKSQYTADSYNVLFIAFWLEELLQYAIESIFLFLCARYCPVSETCAHPHPRPCFPFAPRLVVLCPMIWCFFHRITWAPHCLRYKIPPLYAYYTSAHSQPASSFQMLFGEQL